MHKNYITRRYLTNEVIVALFPVTENNQLEQLNDRIFSMMTYISSMTQSSLPQLSSAILGGTNCLFTKQPVSPDPVAVLSGKCSVGSQILKYIEQNKLLSKPFVHYDYGRVITEVTPLNKIEQEYKQLFCHELVPYQEINLPIKKRSDLEHLLLLCDLKNHTRVINRPEETDKIFSGYNNGRFVLVSQKEHEDDLKIIWYSDKPNELCVIHPYSGQVNLLPGTPQPKGAIKRIELAYEEFMKTIGVDTKRVLSEITLGLFPLIDKLAGDSLRYVSYPNVAGLQVEISGSKVENTWYIGVVVFKNQKSKNSNDPWFSFSQNQDEQGTKAEFFGYEPFICEFCTLLIQHLQDKLNEKEIR